MPTQDELNRTYWDTLNSSRVIEQYMNSIDHDINRDNPNSRSVFCYRFSQSQRDTIREIIDRHFAMLGR